MIKVLIGIFIATTVLFIQACNFLEVRVDVGQRSVLDNGNHKAKKVSDDNSGLETDSTQTIVKTIP